MTTFDMTESIVPRSDQINFEDLLTGPRTITVADVKHGTDEQPVNIITEEFGKARAYKPSKTMRRVLVAAWGKDAAAYIGRRITIYGDPDVTFGKDRVGGIKISHLSHLDRRLEIALTVTRGRRAKFSVEPLPDEPTPSKPNEPPPLPDRISKMLTAFKTIGVFEDQIEAKLGKARDQWQAADVEGLTTVFTTISRGEVDAAQEFPSVEEESK